MTKEILDIITSNAIETYSDGAKVDMACYEIATRAMYDANMITQEYIDSCYDYSKITRNDLGIIGLSNLKGNHK